MVFWEVHSAVIVCRFTLPEDLEAVELTVADAKRMGIPVDTRRGTTHDDNVEALKEFVEDAKDIELDVPKPVNVNKPIRGRAFRGKTSAGKKMRHL